jgi:hypothetical protein
MATSVYRSDKLSGEPRQSAANWLHDWCALHGVRRREIIDRGKFIRASAQERWVQPRAIKVTLSPGVGVRCEVLGTGYGTCALS